MSKHQPPNEKEALAATLSMLADAEADGWFPDPMI